MNQIYDVIFSFMFRGRFILLLLFSWDDQPKPLVNARIEINLVRNTIENSNDRTIRFEMMMIIIILQFCVSILYNITYRPPTQHTQVY